MRTLRTSLVRLLLSSPALTLDIARRSMVESFSNTMAKMVDWERTAAWKLLVLPVCWMTDLMNEKKNSARIRRTISQVSLVRVRMVWIYMLVL